MGTEPDQPPQTEDPNEEPGEPSEPEEDFAAMLEASLQPESLGKGDLVEGTIVAMDSEVAFVDFGGKGEATLDLAELLDEDGDLDAQVGDRVKAVVVSTSGGVKLSNKLARTSRGVFDWPSRRGAGRESHQGWFRDPIFGSESLLPYLPDRRSIHRRAGDSRRQDLRVPGD